MDNGMNPMPDKSKYLVEDDKDDNIDSSLEIEYLKKIIESQAIAINGLVIGVKKLDSIIDKTLDYIKELTSTKDSNNK